MKKIILILVAVLTLNFVAVEPTKVQAAKTETENVIEASSDEIKLLAALIFCEAGNQSYRGKLAVANVVINRVLDDRFPNTIEEVIYQKYQFSPVGNGALAKALKSDIPSKCKKAAKAAIAGENNVEGYYFFTAKKYSNANLKIGDHYFRKTYKGE